MYVKGKRLYSRSAQKVWNRYFATEKTGAGEVVVDFQSDTKDQNELLQQSIKELKERGHMKKTYSTELLDTSIDLRIGDTVPLVDEALEIHLTARVAKSTESQCDDTVSVELTINEDYMGQLWVDTF